MNFTALVQETRSLDIRMIEFDVLKKSNNIAELLDDTELRKISDKAYRGYEHDEESRKEWKDKNVEAMKIAKQDNSEKKDFPWAGASDVKYPLITQATIDFASRTYPEIVQNDRIVKTVILGQDKDESKYYRACRVSSYMSYQMLKKIDHWVQGLDQMLHMLPVLGTIFKKTYYDNFGEAVCSDVCHPDRVVVNYSTVSLEEAPRITHILLMSKNDIVSSMRSGIYREVELLKLFGHEDNETTEFDKPVEVFEQHTWLDLDEDGYSEPYVVTFHKNSREVLRIVNRFDKVEYNDKKQIKRITARMYFTGFRFILSPDGGYYGIGLGQLLLPLNKSINSALNQLLDSGTLHNMQTGLIDSKAKPKNGNVSLKMGEFQVVQVSGQNKLEDYITFTPTKEPSQTTFNLLGLLISATKELVSNTDLLRGQGQTQNVPATTVMSMMEQGLKIYNAILKRLYASLGEEFLKIFRLNSEYLRQKDYMIVLDDPLADAKKDFDLVNVDIMPIADPSMATEAQRGLKAQALLSLPGINEYQAKRYYLASLKFDEAEISRFLPQPDPNAPPPPEVQKTMAEVQKIQAEAQVAMVTAQVAPLQAQLEVAKADQDAKESDSRIQESYTRSAKMQHDAANNVGKLQVEHEKNMSQAALEKYKTDMETNARITDSSLEVRAQELSAMTEYLKLQEMSKKNASTSA